MRHSQREDVADDLYEKIKPRLHRRIGKELRLARAVLDVGCGSCELVRYLADTYRQQVTGIDIASGGFPRRRVSASGARFRCLRRDGARLGFVADRSVDAVVMMWALHEMDRPEAILAEVRRVLRPGGEVLIVDFPRGSLAQRLWNEDYYRAGEVKRHLLRAGFASIRTCLIEQEQVIWARAHQPAEEAA